MPSTTQSAQKATAHTLYILGASLMLFGLCWGFVVPATPFPRLGLTAHIQCMAEGSMILLVGMLIDKPDHVTLSETQAQVVLWGMASVWPTLMTEVANAWWGTKGILPLAAENAGALGALWWQETIVTGMHMVGGVGNVLAFAVLVWGLVANHGVRQKAD